MVNYHAHIDMKTADGTIVPWVASQSDLLADARTEKDALLTNLREMLNETSRGSQMEAQSQEAEFLKTTLSNVPMTIHVG